MKICLPPEKRVARWRVVGTELDSTLTPGPPFPLITMSYIVAYPHPAIRPTERIKRLELGSETTGKSVHGLFYFLYPGHDDDVMGATLRKVGRSTVAQLPSDQHYRPLVSIIRSSSKTL